MGLDQAPQQAQEVAGLDQAPQQAQEVAGLGQPAQQAQEAGHGGPPDDPRDREYSACRLDFPSLAGFSNDLNEQTRPIVGFHVTGNCPRCTHATRAVFPVEAAVMDQSGPRISVGPRSLGVIGSRPLGRLNGVVGTLAGAVGTADPDAGATRLSVMTCQCTNNHKNSKGAFGCGASWLVGAQFDLAAKPLEGADLLPVPEPIATAVWPAAEAYAATASSSLKTVQASAKNWQAALTAILGLVTVVALVGGRATLQTLSGAMQAWIVTLAALAVVANALGIYTSTLASTGFPAIKGVEDAFDLSNSDLWPLRQTIHALHNLRAAMFWSAAAFAAGAVAVGFVWLAPPAAAPAPKVDLTVLQPVPAADPTATVAVAVCGALASPQPAGSPAGIAIVPSTTASPAPTVTYPMTSVAGIAPGTC